jgi:hypothetical protein
VLVLPGQLPSFDQPAVPTPARRLLSAYSAGVVLMTKW